MNLINNFFEQWRRQRFRQFFNQHKDITEEQIQLLQRFIHKQINHPVINNGLNDEEYSKIIYEDMKTNIKQVIDEDMKKTTTKKMIKRISGLNQ